jgi:hypothetical protein
MTIEAKFDANPVRKVLLSKFWRFDDGAHPTAHRKEQDDVW